MLRRGLVQLGIGLSLRLAGAYALSQVLTDVLADVSATDPLTFATITLLLIVTGLARA